MEHKRFWNQTATVNSYKNKLSIQLPEFRFLMEYKREMAGWNMLDIGVGAGRTTLFFAPIVNSYLGIDVAENMIDLCRERFKEVNEIQLETVNATNLSSFADGSFDFVLFSYNGIDYIYPYEERLKCLREINRVLKPKSLFFFSSHNLNFIPEYYKFHWHKKPIALYEEWKRVVSIKKMNPKKIHNPVYFYDGLSTGKNNISTFFISPSALQSELAKAGFILKDIYSLSTGKKLTLQEAELSKEPWLYYSAQTQ